MKITKVITENYIVFLKQIYAKKYLFVYPNYINYIQTTSKLHQVHSLIILFKFSITFLISDFNEFILASAINMKFIVKILVLTITLFLY